jgi:hypothetical protein
VKLCPWAYFHTIAFVFRSRPLILLASSSITAVNESHFPHADKLPDNIPRPGVAGKRWHHIRSVTPGLRGPSPKLSPVITALQKLFLVTYWRPNLFRTHFVNDSKPAISSCLPRVRGLGLRSRVYRQHNESRSVTKGGPLLAASWIVEGQFRQPYCRSN